ncbi:hypothetical protein Nepgr_027340 [Nepenthes gracilis]|uniref:Uncharacterized protein n=1 Tax=Nepenthes gracilis TaxID=150966 RepID=A0AAD3Y156_NEPGR|nr:hypothetical protein Nepgr_027340 [Nepenthes gracilis]
MRVSNAFSSPGAFEFVTVFLKNVHFTSRSPQTLVAVNPSPPSTLIVLFIRTELVALLVGCRRCARCVSARCVVVVAYHCWRENHCCCRRYFLLPWLLTISNQGRRYVVGILVILEEEI